MRYRDLVLPGLTVIGAVILGWVILGPIPAMVFAIAFGGGLVLYLFTSWRTRFDTRTVIVPYLLTIMMFIAHTYEEYRTDFEKLASVMAGRTVSEPDLLLIIAWLAPFLWVGGAIMIVKQWSFGYYFLCAFFVAMTIAELAHFVFPFVIDGTFHYEAGLYTAILPLIPAYYGLYVMIREIRKERRRSRRDRSGERAGVVAR